jgi:hypothetical protein
METGFKFRRGQKCFLFHIAHYAHKTTYPVGASDIFPCAKQPNHDADLSPSTYDEVRNAWSYTSSVEKHANFTSSLKQPVLLGQDTVGSKAPSDVSAKK